MTPDHAARARAIDPQVDSVRKALGPIRAEHLAGDTCPNCTFSTSDATEVFGCIDCNGTGIRTSFALRARLIGGHYHCTMWAGRPSSRANCGTFLLSEAEWPAMVAAIGDNPLITLETYDPEEPS